MTTPPRLADRITAIAGSVDPSGFTPFFRPWSAGAEGAVGQVAPCASVT
jgi:hypothetical protein